MAAKIKEMNIIISGVGGQGVVVMSEILGHAAVRDGLKVMGSEVLGMSQRGGSVFSNIRLGEGIYAPLTADGKCDIMIAFEPTEALRNIQYLNQDSIVIMNTRKIVPSMVSLGKSQYPDMPQIVDKVKASCGKLVLLDALDLAEKAGSRLSVNVVMLGALFGCGKMPIQMDTIKELVTERFGAKASSVNLKAFELGQKVCVD